MNRRRVAARLATGTGLLAAACGIGGGPGGGAGGAGGAPGASQAQASACKGTLDFVSPWGVGSSTGDGLTLLAQDFTAAHPGCSAQLLFVSDNNTTIMEKLVAAIAGGDPPPVTLVPAQQTPLWISNLSLDKAG